MTAPALVSKLPANPLVALRAIAPVDLVAYALTAAFFVMLFAKPASLLFEAWWTSPDAGHGLLLAPLSIWFAWKRGVAPGARPAPILGGSTIALAVVARYAADLASELFVMRSSMLLAIVGLILVYGGVRQLLHWWLPVVLTALSIPIPEVILNTVALPLQFTASKIGAALLRWREIPVRLSGNVILIPGQQLFVAEACSGLRSLTALLSLGVLLGALFLDRWPTRLLLVCLSIPIAILVNGFRVFLTGFLVLFVSPEMGKGFMHTSEGMVMFGGAFLVTALVTWVLGFGERFAIRRGATS